VLQALAVGKSDEPHDAQRSYTGSADPIGSLVMAHLRRVRAQGRRCSARDNDRKPVSFGDRDRAACIGRAVVREYYADHFLPAIPPDLEGDAMSQGAFMLPRAALELGNPTATAIPAERSNSRVNIANATRFYPPETLP